MDYIPSIWDYISQAGTQGLQSYQQSAQRKQEEEARRRAEQMQNVQLMLQLEQQGGMKYNDINPALGALGMAPMTGPSPGGLAAQIASTPEKTMSMPTFSPGGGFGAAPVKMQGKDQFTDAQRQRAGLKTRFQEETERLGNTRDKISIDNTIAEMAQRKDDTSFTASMRPLDRLAKAQPIIKDFAQNYIASAINANGGKRLERKTLEGLSQAAYAKFLEDKNATEFLQTNPSLAPVARAAFGKAMQDAFDEQTQNDLRSQQIGAMYQRGTGRGQGSNVPQMLAQLNTLAKGYDVELKTLRNSGVYQYQTSNPPKPGDEFYSAYKANADKEAELVSKQELVKQAIAGGASRDPDAIAYANSLLVQLGGGQEQAGGQQDQVASPAYEGSKRVVTKDQKKFLIAKGAWDPNKYVVR